MSNPANERRLDEQQRRALADKHRGQVVEGSGVPVEPRRLDQMVSVRLDPAVLRELRTIAESRKTSLSAILREAVVQYTVTADQLTELRWRLEGEVSTSESRTSWKASSVSAGSVRPATL